VHASRTLVEIFNSCKLVEIEHNGNNVWAMWQPTKEEQQWRWCGGDNFQIMNEGC
jgi:hypothetical protein